MSNLRIDDHALIIAETINLTVADYQTSEITLDDLNERLEELAQELKDLGEAA